MRTEEGKAWAVTHAQAATRTCSTVRYRLSVVFFSELVMDTSAKQLTQLANIKVPMNRWPRTDFEMVHTQFPLAYLKASFNRRARKGHPQQPLKRHTRRTDQTIRQKILDLAGVQNISGHDQRMGGTRQTILAMLAIKTSILDLPNYWSLFTILYMKLFPFLFLKCTRIYGQIANLTGRQCLSWETR